MRSGREDGPAHCGIVQKLFASRAETILLVVVGIVAVLLTALHASAVLLYNSPANALKATASPIVRLDSGPWVYQSWRLFAPDPPLNNAHVLVQAKDRRGQVSGWYDVSKFFLARMRENRFTPTRAVAEGLAHGIGMLSSPSQRERAIGREEIIRTAAIVVNLYVLAKT